VEEEGGHDDAQEAMVVEAASGSQRGSAKYDREKIWHMAGAGAPPHMNEGEGAVGGCRAATRRCR